MHLRKQHLEKLNLEVSFKWLKDDSVFATGGGEKNARFFFDSKCNISGSECRRVFKLFLAHTMDPSGPFWGAHPTEKYLHTRRHTLEKNRRKNARFGVQAGWSAPGGVKHQNCFGTHYGPFRPFLGVRTPPKSICTHAGTRLKKIDKICCFLSQAGWSAPGGVKHKNCAKPANPPRFCSETDL